MFIDTHCHLSKEDYEDIEQVLQDDRKEGVSPIIISGCTRNSIVESLEYSNKYSDVYVTIGYHPSESTITSDKDLNLLEKQLHSDKVVGVGEIGLDYHYGKESRCEQLSLFEKQLKLAEKYELPVVIHSRDATYDTIQCLKKYRVTGVIHCFSGSLETAREYIKMGFVLGIGGVVTFKNSNLKNVVEQISINDIVLETDSPYLTPVPYRGMQNNPSHILDIAKFVSELYNVSLEELSYRTNENIKRMYERAKLD